MYNPKPLLPDIYVRAKFQENSSKAAGLSKCKWSADGQTFRWYKKIHCQYRVQGHKKKELLWLSVFVHESSLWKGVYSERKQAVLLGLNSSLWQLSPAEGRQKHFYIAPFLENLFTPFEGCSGVCGVLWDSTDFPFSTKIYCGKLLLLIFTSFFFFLYLVHPRTNQEKVLIISNFANIN